MTAFPHCRPVGYWRWVPNPRVPTTINERLAGETAELPLATEGTLKLETAHALIAYLGREEHVRSAYCGWHTCRICGAACGTEDVSDGVWVWPSGLAHYVGEHRVELPEEFVAWVLSGGQVAPEETVRGWLMLRPHDREALVGSVKALSITPEAAQARMEGLCREHGCPNMIEEGGFAPARVEARVRAGLVLESRRVE